jgi:hypothetical protein
MSSDPPRWDPVAVGTPTVEFEPRPSPGGAYRPDTVADGWSSAEFTVRLASVRGYDHRHRGVPRQDDAVAVHHPATGAVAFAVADGVSAAPLAHLGASAACRAALGCILAELDARSTMAESNVDWAKVVEHAAWQVVQQAVTVLHLDEPDPERAEKEMATTLVAGLVEPASFALVQVGDTTAWRLRDGTFEPLWPPPADEALAVTAVTALPRVPEINVCRGRLAPGEVLLVGTDGFGDPLGDGGGPVGAHFAARLAAPRPPLEFAHDLDFSRETFDDDRTLLAIWPRQMA